MCAVVRSSSLVARKPHRTIYERRATNYGSVSASERKTSGDTSGRALFVNVRLLGDTIPAARNWTTRRLSPLVS